MSHHAFHRALRQSIARHYNLAELRTLVFDLDVDWDELDGRVKSTKIAALVEKMEADGRIPDLLELLAKDHPQVAWPSPPPPPPSPPEPPAEVQHIKNGTVADLSGTVLRGQNLCGAKLSGAKLHDIDWRGAELYLADLSGADLRGADLRRAKMRKANLSHADLTNARLDGADLRLADLTGAKISLAQLASVRKLKGATLPDGTRSPG
ncbi:MAG: pentapeptide repeat-containing protein [Anaerolineae bacterium]